MQGVVIGGHGLVRLGLQIHYGQPSEPKAHICPEENPIARSVRAAVLLNIVHPLTQNRLHRPFAG